MWCEHALSGENSSNECGKDEFQWGCGASFKVGNSSFENNIVYNFIFFWGLMPIYDYKCSDCEHQIEVIQKISDKPRVTCPKCNKKTLKKLISAPSFRLKGGGWYETDFKTGKKKNISSNESSKDDKSKETLKTNPKKASKQDKIKD